MMNLLDALLAQGIRFRRNVSDLNEFTICCPYCNEKRFRLGFNVAKDKAQCFNCGWRSRRALEDLAEAMQLGELVAGEIEQAEESKPEPPALPDDFILLSQPLSDALYKKALSYLKKRGVTDRQIEDKKIGVSLVGRYAYRIVFPIYYGRKLQGLVTRDFTAKQEPKYLNSPGVKKSLYNLPRKKKDKAVLCEGIFDCLAIERIPSVAFGWDVLALLGHDVTDEQEERLEGYRELVLWPDADIAGIRLFDAARRLSFHHRVCVVPPFGHDGKDAGGLTPVELAQLWTNRTRLTEAVEMRIRAAAAFDE